MKFTTQFVHNTCRIPSYECTRSCKKPCQDHKSQACLQVLGSDPSLSAFASFWAQNAEAVTVAASSLINTHAFTAKFTPEEFDSYRGGVMDMVTFLEMCLQEKLDRERPKE
jgi:hypothetical protein